VSPARAAPAPICLAGYVDCGGECRDVSGDPEFCGACAPVGCDADRFCSDGACACRPGLTECGGACVDTGADRDHCGDCDMPCEGATSTCVDGACASGATCALEVCDGACVDTSTNVAHCGGCGSACAVDQVCIARECWDYEPAVGCTSCDNCDACPTDEPCCDLPDTA
jgi:hypothetical protein